MKDEEFRNEIKNADTVISGHPIINPTKIKIGRFFGLLWELLAFDDIRD